MFLQTHTQTCIKYVCRKWRERPATCTHTHKQRDTARHRVKATAWIIHAFVIWIWHDGERKPVLWMRNKSHSNSWTAPSALPHGRSLKLRGSRYGIQRICLFGNKFRCILLSLLKLLVSIPKTWLPATEIGRQQIVSTESIDNTNFRFSDPRLEWRQVIGVSYRFFRCHNLFFAGARRSNLTRAGNSRFFFSSGVCSFKSNRYVVYLVYMQHAQTHAICFQSPVVWPKITPIVRATKRMCAKKKIHDKNTKITFSDRAHLTPAVKQLRLAQKTRAPWNKILNERRK